MNHLSIEQILYIHDLIIEQTGGNHGLRDFDLLTSAVGRPRAGRHGAEFYPTLFAKAAALMSSLVQGHPFVDGNRRTGITSAGVLLSINGRDLTASNNELYSFTMMVVDEKPDIDDIAAWLKVMSRSRSA